MYIFKYLGKKMGFIKSEGLTGKRSQGMPMSTIVLIILVLIVLAAVGIMFFINFGTGTKSFSDSSTIASNQITNFKGNATL
jgi:flagellar basal body-associated protein FliL